MRTSRDAVRLETAASFHRLMNINRCQTLTATVASEGSAVAGLAAYCFMMQGRNTSICLANPAAAASVRPNSTISIRLLLLRSPARVIHPLCSFQPAQRMHFIEHHTHSR